MWTVFKLQWKRLFKNPFLILLFLGLTVAFVYIMGGMQGASDIVVQTYSEDLSSVELNTWIDRLNEEETYRFEETDYETVYEELRMNETPFALEIGEDNYRFILGRDETEASTIIQYVEQVFATEQRIQEVKDAYPGEEIDLEEFIVVDTTARTDTATINEGNSMGVLIGMTLYFTIYSILYLMINLVEEKRMGTWNRLIFSPLSKTKIYIGQLFHYFLVGIFQIILAFSILRYLMGIDFGSNYISMLAVASSFMFAIVALGILVMGIVESPQQLNVVIPIVATGMAMIGGAFWPLEIVSNRLLLLLSRVVPIRYGIEGLRGAIIQEQSLSQLGEPIAALLLMGVLFMGIGLNLMERVSEKRSI